LGAVSFVLVLPELKPVVHMPALQASTLAARAADAAIGVWRDARQRRSIWMMP
jgi:hypothetical protein